MSWLEQRTHVQEVVSSNRLTPKIICTTLLLVFHRKDLREAKPKYSVQNFAQNRPFTLSPPESMLGKADYASVHTQRKGS